ncbi:MAG: chemotaxis protein CheX [Nitrospirota bacterium]
MRYEYIEPLLISTMKVLANVMQSELRMGDVSLIRPAEIKSDIAVIIKLEGDSTGGIIVNMGRETALNICNVMTGEKFKTLTPLALDAISELTNMIAGNATSAINDLGFDFKILPPSSLTKEEMITGAPWLEIFQVPLLTRCGEIKINIAMRTN